MNPPSMESIFLILSGVILLAGVLYWFWSHIQLTQKKVQLLENSIFELRDTLSKLPGGRSRGPSDDAGGFGAAASASDASDAAGAPAYADLDDNEEDWDSNDLDAVAGTSVAAAMTPKHDVFVSREGEEASDLMPGGRMSGVVEEVEAEIKEVAAAPADDFRSLFTQEAAPAPAPVRTPESLESMSVKELRRLAEQRGISGTSDMRKKEILAALRQQVAPAAPTTVAVERTLDLVEEGAEVAEGAEVVEATADDGELKELTLE